MNVQTAFLYSDGKKNVEIGGTIQVDPIDVGFEPYPNQTFALLVWLIKREWTAFYLMRGPVQTI